MQLCRDQYNNLLELKRIMHKQHEQSNLIDELKPKPAAQTSYI